MIPSCPGTTPGGRAQRLGHRRARGCARRRQRTLPRARWNRLGCRTGGGLGRGERPDWKESQAPPTPPDSAGPRGENLSRNDFRRGGGSLPRHGPTHRQVVTAATLFLERFNVIFLAGDQIDRCRLLGAVNIPNLGIGPAGHRGNQGGIGWTGIGAQPQCAVVVAGNPEHIAAGKWRGDESTNSRAIIVRPIDRPHETGQQGAAAGIVWIVGVVGQITDGGARNVQPVFPQHRSGGVD